MENFMPQFQDLQSVERRSTRVVAKASLQPTEDALQGDEADDKLGDLASFTAPGKRRSKRSSAPPPSSAERMSRDSAMVDDRLGERPSFVQAGMRRSKRLSAPPPSLHEKSAQASAMANDGLEDLSSNHQPAKRRSQRLSAPPPDLREKSSQGSATEVEKPGKRRRSSEVNDGIVVGTFKRSKLTPALMIPEVPEAPDNQPRTPKSTGAATYRDVGDGPVIPSSAPTLGNVNESPTSTATLGRAEATRSMEDEGLAQESRSTNYIVTQLLPRLGHGPKQPSIPETEASDSAATKETNSNHQQAQQVLSTPPTSPLSTPPSSPTLRAQGEDAEMSTNEITAESKSEKPGVASDGDKPSEDAEVSRTPPTDPIRSLNDTNIELDHSSPPGGPADTGTTTPTPKAPVQLPTPASSNGSFAEPMDLSPWIGASGRTIKAPARYGNLVETPVTSEEQQAADEVDAEFDPDMDETATKKQPAKKASVPSKSKQVSTFTPKAKATTKAKEKTTAAATSRVTKTKKTDTPSKESPAPKSGAKPRGRPSKKNAQTRASIALEEGTTTISSKSITLTVSTKPKELKAIVAPDTAPKGRKKPPAEAKFKPTEAQTKTKSTGRKNTKNEIALVRPKRPPVNIDPAKLALSQKLTHREPLDSKPEPQGQPRVWAESRQALCETLPYFKKPQGGCYSNEGHIYGFLFDGVGHCREYVDENLILCRAGGSMEADSANGGMIQKKDQTMTESQVLSVLNDMKHHNPLIVICGNRNISTPTKMPHQYNVLGWYKPVFVWAEKTQGKGTKVWTTIKYRLERLNQHLAPAWHSPNDGTSYVSDKDRAIAGPLFSKECEHCHDHSPQIYLSGWMCLNPECNEFWMQDGYDASFGTEDLDYDPAFLLHRFELWKNDDQEQEPVPADVKPPVPKVGDIIGDNLYYINTRGVCCPECGRCNSRRRFKGWVCENCGWKEYPVHKPVLPTMLHTPWDAAPTLVRNRVADGVHIESKHWYGYKMSRYTFDGIQGCFIHLAAPKQILEEEKGPNEMFAKIQTVDMDLERRVFAVSKMSGGRSEKPKDAIPDAAREATADPASTQEEAEAGDGSANKTTEEFAPGDLMTAFSMNYGMPYKFVASGGSQSFEDAPWPVTETRRRLNWAQKTFLSNQDEYMDFNEQLIFAYLEGQKIEYHDDGESGLGPRIATLSLGGRAKMHIRMKGKHYVGCSKTGIFTEEKPVPGSIGGEEMYKKRQEKWSELQAIKHDTAAYNKMRKDIPKELGLFEKKMKKAEDLVMVTLSHGDIIIMDGYDIQKYLEHKVVPEGYLRFALTCRTVLPDHLKPEERPTYTVEEDPVTYDGPKLGNSGNEMDGVES